MEQSPEVRPKIESPWAAKINRDNPLPEYPRPGFVRKEWVSLNGPWDYAITPSSAETPPAEIHSGEQPPEQFDGTILVPYAPESALSGVGRALLPEEVLWYRRRASIPVLWKGRRVLLNFEAVDYSCAVFLNGRFAGGNRGGYLPFSIEIPAEELSGSDGFEIMLAVRDPGDSSFQERGKQVLNPKGIYYTATSGIWQSVWLEPVAGENSIAGIDYKVLPDLSGVELTVNCVHPAEIRVAPEESGDSGSLFRAVRGVSGEAVVIRPETPRLWSPDDPFLYFFRAEIAGPRKAAAGASTARGALRDSVVSYFALRNVVLERPGRGCAEPAGKAEEEPAEKSTEKTAVKINGKLAKTPVIKINGKPVFLQALLDQGYWPESGLTPPAEEALLFDIESAKNLGFNALRKHVKIETRRFYYHADRLGMLIMQDAVSGGRNRAGTLRTAVAMFLGIHSEDRSASAHIQAGRGEKQNREEFEAHLRGMVKHLKNHPSIIMWVPFNESWGQFDSRRICGELRKNNPDRLIDSVSGWYDQGSGDFRSRHTYIIPLFKPPRRDPRPYFISEYGGYNLSVKDHMWTETERFGYRFYKDPESLKEAYTRLIRKELIPLIRKGLRAAVYTQISDVEMESNGLFTYDRKVLKIEEEMVRSLNRELYAAFEEIITKPENRGYYNEEGR